MTVAHDAPAWPCSCGLHAYYEPSSDARAGRKIKATSRQRAA